MGKRALRTGELVTVHQSVGKHGAMMFADPEDKVKGAPVGRFTFGMYMSLVRGPDLQNGGFASYVYVLDSASMRAGWCLAKLIRRPDGHEDG